MHDLDFHLKPSKRYIVFLSLMLIAAAAVLMALKIGMLIKWTLIMVLVIYGYWLMRQFGLLHGQQSIIGLRRQSDGAWLIKTNQFERKATLRGDSTVTQFVS